MKIYLISNNKKYVFYWKSIVEQALSSELDMLPTFKDEDIVIIDNSLYNLSLETKAKIIVLDNEPNFEKCLSLLNSGVKAYGNIYMHSAHIHSAIETIKDSKIWMYPDFIANIIGNSQKSDEKLLEEKIEVLTKREKEITKLILNGLTNKEIAIELKISPNTIKNHTKNIYEKLSVSDRLSLFSLLK